MHLCEQSKLTNEGGERRLAATKRRSIACKGDTWPLEARRSLWEPQHLCQILGLLPLSVVWSNIAKEFWGFLDTGALSGDEMRMGQSRRAGGGAVSLEGRTEVSGLFFFVFFCLIQGRHPTQVT